MGFVKCAGNI